MRRGGFRRAARPRLNSWSLIAAVTVLAVLLPGCSDNPIVLPEGPHPSPTGDLMTAAAEDNLVLQWNRTLLDAVSASTLGPPMVARALAVVHTAIFDAWAAYDQRAVGTRLGGSLRRPAAEHTLEHQREAISYAAYRTLTDLFPAQEARFRQKLVSLGYDPADTSTDLSRPAGVGNVAAAAVLEFCHGDGANQLGELHPSGVPYRDYTGYQPVNTPTAVIDVNRWQPLVHPNRAATGQVTQAFLGAQWNRVTPFALHSAAQFRPPPPRFHPHGLFREQAEELIRLSANLTEREKMIVEYWADGPGSVLPPGHFHLFAQYVSRRDGHSLDQDVKLFFVLASAVHDAAIAAWDAKIHYDYVRPITAIRSLKQGQRIRAWAGPGQNVQTIAGEQWRPYQPEWFPTPPFSEYVSGHSTFSAASAEILRRFTGSDHFGAAVLIVEAPLGIEPGLPSAPVTLSWPTFSAAADEAGLSRRLGGIHFRDGDLEGRKLGRRVAEAVWQRAQQYVEGSATP